jgi:arginase family enzyme
MHCSDLDDISNRVDFIICLGGDGTLLYASSLFQVYIYNINILWYSKHIDLYIFECTLCELY